MALAILNEIQEELNRLCIAGSSLAAGDPRIKKFAAPLRKLGEKAPVFNALAERLEALCGGDGKAGPEALLEAGVLLYSLRYTQGSTDTGGGLSEMAYASRPLKQHGIPWSRFEQLGSREAGGKEAVEALYNEGIYTDHRLFPFYCSFFFLKNNPAYTTVTETIIPALGKEIVPALKAVLDLKGNVQHAAVFRAICRIEGKAVYPLAEKALSEGETEVKAEALRCLWEDSRYEETLVAFAGDRKAEIREAAYTALAKMKSAKVEALLLAELDKKQISALEIPLSLIESSAVYDKMIGTASRLIDNLIPAPGGAALPAGEKDAAKLKVLLRVFARRHEEAGLETVKNILYDKDTYAKTAHILDLTGLYELLFGRGDAPPPSRAKLEILCNLPEHDDYALRYRVLSAARIHSPGEVYDMLAPVLKKLKRGSFAFANHLAEAYGNLNYLSSILLSPPDSEKKWDRRWAGLFLSRDGNYTRPAIYFIYDDDDAVWKKLFAVELREAEQALKKGGNISVYHYGKLLCLAFDRKRPEAEEYYNKFIAAGLSQSQLDEAIRNAAI
ncbi:MAG: HEAT repeat domain-containing protein [Treponema sp.]|jgi:hypothetical protein|nr:HEAT repeat domain-containing protein [Treponema sp.]